MKILYKQINKDNDVSRQAGTDRSLREDRIFMKKYRIPAILMIIHGGFMEIMAYSG